MDKFGNLNCTLSDLRTTTLALVSFAGFLRFCGAVRTRRSDVSFYQTYCCIMIRESKTGVYRQGDQLGIARTGTPFCPVNMLERYFATAGLNDSTSNKFIFRAVMFCSKFNKHVLRPDKFWSLSYSTVRSIFLTKLSDLGLNPKGCRWHSLRAGGASICANRGTVDRLWKRHGRWTSEKTKDGYVTDGWRSYLTWIYKLNHWLFCVFIRSKLRCNLFL